MIYIRSEDEIAKIHESNRIVYKTLIMLSDHIKPGITTRHLDALAEEYIHSQDGRPAFKGYRGYPATICTSLNEQVVHGIPSERQLKEGDIIGIDIGVEKEGYFGDAAYTFAVGQINAQQAKLLQVTREALYFGVRQALPGGKLSDIGHAIQSHAEQNGFSVVRSLVGHGIGRSLHEQPEVPNFGKAGKGPTLKAGMCLAIEPMVNLGTYNIRTLNDGWTVVTADGSLSAHFEHTIAITKQGPFILGDNKEEGGIEFYGKRKIN